MDIYVLYKFSKHQTIYGEYCVHKLNYRYFGNPVMHGQIWLIFEKEKGFMDIYNLFKFSKHRLINRCSSVFTSSIIEICLFQG